MLAADVRRAPALLRRRRGGRAAQRRSRPASEELMEPVELGRVRAPGARARLGARLGRAAAEDAPAARARRLPRRARARRRDRHDAARRRRGARPAARRQPLRATWRRSRRTTGGCSRPSPATRASCSRTTGSRSSSATRPSTTRSPGCRTGPCSPSRSRGALGRTVADRPQAGRPVRRPRRLQDDQRQPRPRAPATSCSSPSPTACSGVRPPERRRGAPRRRRVRGPARRRRAQRRGASRGAHARRAARAVRRSRAARCRCTRASGSPTPARRRERRRAAAQRGRGDVHGEERRQAAATRATSRRCTSRIRRRHELAAALEHAIERDELDVHYQPIVALAIGGSSRVEALARWHHPTRGLLPPDSSSRSPRRPA